MQNPYGHNEKDWKLTKDATCVYEGEYVSMKGKRKGFLTKIDRRPVTKKAGKSRKGNLYLGNLYLWSGIYAHEGKKYKVCE